MFIISFEGPLTVAGTNTIVGTVQGGHLCTKDVEKRVGVYLDVLKPVVQSFIKEIVPDVAISSLWNELTAEQTPKTDFHLNDFLEYSSIK